MEEAFQAKLDNACGQAAEVPETRPGGPRAPRRDPKGPEQERQDPARTKAVDKSVLALPEPRRVRDRDHVQSVAKRPCLICGRQPSDAHHLRFAQSRALGRKVSDEFTVPLCRGHHREVHRCGDEAAWWRTLGLIRPSPPARCGWERIRSLPSRTKQRQRRDVQCDRPTLLIHDEDLPAPIAIPIARRWAPSCRRSHRSS